MNSLYLDFLGEIDQLQRSVERMAAGTSSLRAEQRGSFPALNIGTTDQSVEILAFAPGIDPKTLEVTIDKGVLVLGGERKPLELPTGAKPYAQERFSGMFRRTVELPQNVDPEKIEARYLEGCLKISIAKQQPSKPKSISIQHGE